MEYVIVVYKLGMKWDILLNDRKCMCPNWLDGDSFGWLHVCASILSLDRLVCQENVLCYSKNVYYVYLSLPDEMVIAVDGRSWISMTLKRNVLKKYWPSNETLHFNIMEFHGSSWMAFSGNGSSWPISSGPVHMCLFCGLAIKWLSGSGPCRWPFCFEMYWDVWNARWIS